MSEQDENPVIASQQAAEAAVDAARTALQAAESALEAARAAAARVQATDPVGRHSHASGVPFDEHGTPQRKFPPPPRRG